MSVHCRLCVGMCVSDLGYGNNEKCNVTAKVTLANVTAVDFDTESCCDHVTINGFAYSGTTGPKGVLMPAGAVLSWSSDYSVTLPGWTICAEPLTSDYWEITSGTVRGCCSLTLFALICTPSTLDLIQLRCVYFLLSFQIDSSSVSFVTVIVWYFHTLSYSFAFWMTCEVYNQLRLFVIMCSRNMYIRSKVAMLNRIGTLSEKLVNIA